jgi:hypothetical protein
MDEENEPFWKLVKNSWVIIVCGSVSSAAWTVWTSFNPQIPSWVAWVLLVGGFLYAIWRAGSHTHSERRKLAERLKPKLEICGVAEIVDDHRRIDILNLTDRRIQFRARLVSTEPQLKDYSLPVSLQPTHCQDNETLGEIGPRDHARALMFVSTSKVRLGSDLS